jgi:trans-aconitate methyltransferase
VTARTRDHPYRMFTEIEHRLRSAADLLQARGLDALPVACRAIPLEIFGAIQIDRPEPAQQLLRFLPTMPSDDVQLLWTGSSGHTLLAQSIAFVRTLVAHLPIRLGSSADPTIFDFGCGWGRHLRLACKFIPPSRLWAVDPWDRSIELCKEHGVLGEVRMSSSIPRQLDVPEDFELVYAFSVFTHLPQEVAVISLRTLYRHMASGARLVLTIRPVEYWAWHNFSASTAKGYSRERSEAEHWRAGYSFVPSDHPKTEGIVTYGDTSMTVEFAQRLAAPLQLIAVEWSAVDTFQLVLVFEKP